MEVINALVYKSEKDEKYVAESREATQIGIGDNEEEAKSELLTALCQVRELSLEDKTIGFFDECASERCKRGIEYSIKQGIKPKIAHVKDLEVHFYVENGRFKEDFRI